VDNLISKMGNSSSGVSPYECMSLLSSLRWFIYVQILILIIIQCFSLICVCWSLEFNVGSKIEFSFPLHPEQIRNPHS
jgi:hypothetical protein